MPVPYVIEKDKNHNERIYDIYSRLLKDRVILVGEVIESNMANSIVAQLLFLEANDSESTIRLYINSPGGEIVSGLAIYDTIKYIKNDVSTLCYGRAASMASLLLAAGTPKKRFILSNAEVLIHQPVGGFRGQVSDIRITHDHIISTQKRLYDIYCEITGKSYEQIKKDCDRDFFMTAEQAVEYGLVDEVLKTSKKD